MKNISKHYNNNRYLQTHLNRSDFFFHKLQIYSFQHTFFGLKSVSYLCIKFEITFPLIVTPTDTRFIWLFLFFILRSTCFKYLSFYLSFGMSKSALTHFFLFIMKINKETFPNSPFITILG